MKKIRVLIADDQDVIRTGLKSLLKGSKEFSVIGVATNGRDTAASVLKSHPDVALIDVSMPEMNGIEATRLIRQRDKTVKILALTIHDHPEYVFQMLQAGANGYILKDAGRKELFAAIRSVDAGEVHLSPGISKMMVEKLLDPAAAPIEATASPNNGLTKRESEVLRYIAEGHSNKKIAEKLFLSVKTVNTHRTNLMKKLDIHDTAGLVRYAIKENIIQVES